MGLALDRAVEALPGVQTKVCTPGKLFAAGNTPRGLIRHPTWWVQVEEILTRLPNSPPSPIAAPASRRATG
jgi:hypothetical protein